jgi:hypothetical protein
MYGLPRGFGDRKTHRQLQSLLRVELTMLDGADQPDATYPESIVGPPEHSALIVGRAGEEGEHPESPASPAASKLSREGLPQATGQHSGPARFGGCLDEPGEIAHPLNGGYNKRILIHRGNPVQKTSNPRTGI